jgi:oxygen-independent coproporphyrinogen-3 oxidase
VKHLYVHVPFCQGKCFYCGFYSVMAELHQIAVYPELPQKESLLRLSEFPGHEKEEPLETIYIGGGTPAMLGVDGIKSLADGINERFPLHAIREWTVEMHPLHADDHFFRALREMGVNRISIGVQSFCDETLQRIGRRHTAQEAFRAIQMAQDQGFGNTGVDLIAGLPGVDEAEWSETVNQALALGLPHLSVYALSLEEGPPLARQVGEGTLVIPGDDAVLDMLASTEAVLSEAGYERYEISNYAQPGYACEHNLGIWRGNDFLGLGPSAASRIGVRRWTNSSDLCGYMDALSKGAVPPGEADSLDPMADAVERVIFALRLQEGFDPYTAAVRFPILESEADGWEKRLEACARQGLVERGGLRWRLTARGSEVCDAVIRDVFLVGETSTRQWSEGECG